MSTILAIAAAAMPLPPPGQIAKGVGSIPELRNAPVIPWSSRTIPAVNWRCELEISGRPTIELEGRFKQVDGVSSGERGYGWPPYTWAEVKPGAGHEFQGAYLTTISPGAYGFRFASDASAYEVTIRLNEGSDAGRIEFRRLRPYTDWEEIGAGDCTTELQPLEGQEAA